ncbi:MAG: WbqC family protein [Planctomycetota bacterium]
MMQHEKGRKRIFAGNQPTYLPWIGIFEQMMYADVFVVCDDFRSSFPGWLNRNKIKGRDGTVWLAIPVVHPQDLPINRVEIFNKAPWRRKHLRSIEMCYGRAPFFEKYIDRLREIYGVEWRCLSDFTVALIRYFRECLGIEKELAFSSALGVSGTKNSLVVDLCRKTGCDAAYLAEGTRAYVDEKLFRQAGIEVEYQDFEHPVYPQQYGGFISHMSVLDILMNCGPESAEIIRRAGELSRPSAAVTNQSG